MSEPRQPLPIAPTLLSPDSGPSVSAPTAPWLADAEQLIAGRYQLTALVAQGGMGTVYRAIDRELEETVALKVLRQEIVAQPGVLERFRREVKLARRVTHPNVARTFDIGEHDGIKFLTLEFVDGRALRAELIVGRPLAEARAVSVASAVALGLEAAHAVGIVHRDLKPENILLGQDGRILISDFGIARADSDGAGLEGTQGLVLGTPMYMAPEQVEGRPVDARADLFALGVMLYEMLTGQQPYRGNSAVAIAAARLTATPPDPRSALPGLDPSLAELTVELLQADPAARPATARTVHARLAAIVGQGVLSTRPHVLPKGVRTPAAPSTVAVLPLLNRGTPDQDYLADGLTEDLIDQLAMGGALRVRPYGAVQRFGQRQRGAAPDPNQVGRELDVDIVVEGSLQKHAESTQVRVTIRATQVKEGFQIWAQRFDVPSGDLLRLSDQIAAAIVAATTGQQPARPRRAATDSGAIDLYLRARHQLQRFDLANLQEVIELADEALRIAPDDPAFVVLGATLQSRAWFNGVIPSADRADMLARRALELAPDRAEPHLAMATLELQRNNFGSAIRYLAAALQRNAMLPEAHFTAAHLLAEIGEMDRATQFLETTLRLDASQLFAYTDLARIHLLLGRREEGLAYLDRCAAFTGHSMWSQMARFLVWVGDAERAARWLTLPDLADDRNLIARNVLLRIAGQPDATADLLQQFNISGRMTTASARGRSFAHQIITEFFAGQQLYDQALNAVEQAVAAGLIDHPWMTSCPLLAPLRERPRFAELTRVVATRAEGLRSLASEL